MNVAYVKYFRAIWTVLGFATRYTKKLKAFFKVRWNDI